MTSSIAIRRAAIDDVPLILQLIRELAEYEKLTHEVSATESQLCETLFGPRPVAEVVIASWEGVPVGFAVFFANYSTFLGRPGLYLEDLFVRPEARGRGIGRALLEHLAGVAVERRWGRLEWRVLDWNAPSIAFYRKLGAEPLDDWTVFRVAGDGLRQLAHGIKGE
jgi:GNAT superfamily N-acetyltransferase